MSRALAVIEKLRALGLGAEAILAVIEAIEAPELTKARSGAAERMARYRAKRKENGMQAGFDGGAFAEQLIKRDGDACIYCGDTESPAAVDHLFPICQGGTDDMDNLGLACRACNGKKSGRTPEQAGMDIKNETARLAYVRYCSGEQFTRTVSKKEMSPTPPERKNPPSKENPPKGGQKKGSPLSPDWAPTAEDFSAAKALLGSERAAMELAKFRDYWPSVPGKNRLKLDWDGTWRNWVRKAADFAPRPSVGLFGKPQSTTIRLGPDDARQAAKSLGQVYVLRDSPEGEAWNAYKRATQGKSQWWDQNGGNYFPSALPPVKQIAAA